MTKRLEYLKEVSPNSITFVGVGVLVIDNSRVLLEQRADCGLWSVPGGRIDPGENIATTATREVKEETNLDVDIQGLFAIYSDPKYGTVRKFSEDDFTKQCVDIIMLAFPTNFDIKKSDESLDVRFFDIDNLPVPLIMTPTTTEILKDYKIRSSDRAPLITLGKVGEALIK
jgi:ADP-ribose pyrophosphatase YjhB (NUDIX family)